MVLGRWVNKAHWDSIWTIQSKKIEPFFCMKRFCFQKDEGSLNARHFTLKGDSINT